MWHLRKHTVLSIPGLTLVALATAYGIAFLAYIGVSTKRNRIVRTNDYTSMWLTLLGLLLSIQALFVISAYRSANRYLYWTIPWMAYGGVMSVFALCVCGGYGSVHQGGAATWGVFWLLASCAIIAYAGKARRGYIVDRIMGIPEYHPRLAESRGRMLLYVALDNVFPWVTWTIGLFFGILVAVQALCLANDRRLYGVPGRLVPVQTHGGEYWFNLHVWCQGYGAREQASGTPVFVLLADFGMPSTSMLGLAEGFAAAGHPACIIDRPGYGWSEPGYWMQDPVDVVKSINQALTKYPIANPIVLVGWGEGGVWAQMYMQAADYSRVIGVVLLDTYPNEEILQTFALNRTTTLQNLRQLRSASTTSTSPSVHFDAALERSASNLFSAWRAVSPLALHRARNSAWPGFQPQSALNMHRAMFRNNLYYQAKYFEYAGTGAALYRGLLSYVGSDTDAVLVYHHWPLRWPAFRQESGAAFSNASLKRRDGAPTAPASSAKIPVLVVASARQFNSDCGVQGIGDAEQCTVWQAFAWFYYRQQIEYQQTLSQNAALLLCQGRVAEDNTECDVGFVWRRPGWLAQAIVSQLISQPAGTSSVASATSAEETNSAASSETSLESQTDSVASTQSTPSESSVESQFSASFATQSAFAETSITF